MKKKGLLVFAFVSGVLLCNAQIEKPVTWKFFIKKTNATLYEIHLAANINDGWHIYSQATPDGGPVATSIGFNNNPLLMIKDKAKENGKLETKNEPLFGVDVKQYEHTVDFVQIVHVKAPVKTNVTGSVEFMACNNTQCLPPTKQTFSLVLQ